MSLSRRSIAIIIILAALIAPSALIFSGVLRKQAISAQPVALLWWTVEDSRESLQDVIAAYRGSHPQITITVEQKSAATYFDELKTAWAQDRGPDIFSLPNTAIAGWQDFIQPVPKETTVATVRTRNLLVREEQEVALVKTDMLTPRQVRSTFVDVVGKDVILPTTTGEKVYGFPLAMDTLMLFYNRDLLNSAGLTEPATTWQEFAAQVPRLTLEDTSGAVVRPGAGFGLAGNVPHAADLVSLLMLQNGARMLDVTEQTATFHQANLDGERPGLGALTFYTDFAQINPPQETLTWNSTFPSALDLFTQGRLAYAFGYQSDRTRITNEAPGLNFQAAAIPHILENELDNDASAPAGDQARKITFGKYWVQSVALKARDKANEAWDFLQFIATNDANKTYLGRSNQVPAVRSFIGAYQNTTDYAVPAVQALAARSWYHGRDAELVDRLFVKLIDDVALSGADPARGLDLVANQIEETLIQREQE